MAIYFRESNSGASDEPMFVISVAARLVEMHPQTLRYYERAGLVKPKRSRGSIRLYSERDIERLRKIARLVDDLGVNLAGVEVIMNLTEKLQVMQNILQENRIQVPELMQETDPQVPAETPDSVMDTPASPNVKIQVRRPRKTMMALTKTNKE